MGNAYFFGQFKADIGRGDLERAGAKVRLQQKPFSVLAILLENAGQTVSREELRDRLWPAGTFVEFDEGLNAAVKKLRIALGDAPDRPRFVETVPRRGYRFIAPVRVESPIPVADAEPVRTVPVQRDSNAMPAYGMRSRIWRLTAVMLGIPVVVAAGFTIRSRAPQRPPVRSIAVLPLENLSHDEEQSFFADGITDELITDLAKTGAIRVISRTSVMRYRGTTKPIPEVARELDVDAVVEGTVYRSGDHISLRAQLIRAEPEGHIWAETYDRPRGDLATLQSELAHDIAAAIRIKLRPQQEETFDRDRAIDPEAHELYLKGRYFWNKRNPEANEKAFEYFQKALEKDPNYAQAYAGLADAYVFSGSTLPRQVASAKAREMDEKALSLDPDLAEAHATLGLIAPLSGWNWQGADRELKRAIELNPNLATAYQWHAEIYLASMGRMDEAIAEMRKAEELDPLSPIIATDVGKMLLYAGRWEEAKAQLQKALELDPEFSQAHGFLSGIYFELGKYEEAGRELERIRSAADPDLYLGGLIALQSRTGQRKRAQQEMAELLEHAESGKVDPLMVASRYVYLGDKENALRWLNRGASTGTAWAGTLNTNSVWDALRADPRFDEIRRKYRLIG